MVVMAFAMISEGLDNSTIASIDATGTRRRDPFKFAFEQTQPSDLVADIAEMCAGDGMGVIAGHVRLVGELEQRPDALDGESEIARMLDEGQSFPMTATIAPLIAFRPLRFW